MSTTTAERTRRDEKVEAALELLAHEVGKLVSGEDWQRCLEAQARFHQYSPRNALLIVAQHQQAYKEGRVSDPDPGYVAGYRTWQSLGRQVMAGQRGYVVLAPVSYSYRTAIDEHGHSRRLVRGEEPRPGEVVETRHGIHGWRAEYVFSQHQTSGASLPEPPQPQLLSGQAPPGLARFAEQMLAERGWTVEFVRSAGDINGANGVTVWSERAVRVRSDMDEAAQAKTLVHELAHVLMHDPSLSSGDLPRPVKEVEAESVAFVVCRAHGMATDGYSFPYVASWAGEDAAASVAAAQARIGAAARVVLEASPLAHDAGGRPPTPTPITEAPTTPLGCEPLEMTR